VEIAACVLSLPERAPLLTECLDSIDTQTRKPDDVVVGIDPYRLGQVGNSNRLLDATDSEWVAFVDSDDLWYPNHLAVCETFMDDADVVVSRYDLIGRPWSSIEPWHHDFADLRWTNWIGSLSMVCFRREVFGRMCEPYGRYCWIDWANYNRLLDAGARFVDTGLVTTQYRFGDWSNGSWRAIGGDR